MSALVLRTEKAQDVDGIRAVHEAAFPTSLEARLVDALRSTKRLLISIVAEDPGEGIIGHVAFSPVLVADATKGLGLAPVAVLPLHQRQGIGAHLIEEGLRVARQAHYQFVVVLGEPHYYQRFGFKPAAQFALQDEYEGGDAFQVLELETHGIPKMGGLVRYAPEFAIVAGQS